jgi:HlyD family secretion protein
VTGRRRALIVAGAAIVLAAGVAAWWVGAGRDGRAGWQGYVDADYVRVGPTLQGLLTEVSVVRGQQIQAGTPLFAQDPVNDQGARDEAAAKLKEAEARFKNVATPSRTTEIAQAEGELIDLRAARDRARMDCDRSKALVGTGAVSRQRLDQDCADAVSTAARVDSAEAKLAQFKSPTGREPEIDAAEAVVAESRAQLVQADWRLTQRRVTAPVAARVADVYARPGETLAAGEPVVSLLPPDNVLIRFFVPESVLPHLAYGDRLSVSCDSCPPGFTAIVSFVSPQAEYTPPVIYSESTREKFIYLIEARPQGDARRTLKPGQPVTVRPETTAR